MAKNNFSRSQKVNSFYYVGPVDPVRDESRWSCWSQQQQRVWINCTRQVLKATGLFGMIGKADRGPAAGETIKTIKQLT